MNGKIGMLWYDPNPKSSLSDKISRACDWYRGKYGEPGVCFISEDLLPENKQVPEIEGIRIIPHGAIQPNHFWIGAKQDDKSAA
jgi:hypothetical protein